MSNPTNIPFHRCRFAKWRPYGITALAFNTTGSRLAISRENGDIEIWNVNPVFFCEKRIPGYGEASVQSLLWLPSLSTDDYDSEEEAPSTVAEKPSELKERLLSVGLNGRIIEWNLQLLTPLFASDSFGGAIWAATLDSTKQTLCAGCEDGTLRLFDVTNTTSTSPIVYLKSFARHTGRVLCVCWKYDIIISGGVDGVIKFWNPETGVTTGRITLESMKGVDNYVWSVDMIGELTIVSGDSYGKVQLWDRTFGTLITTFTQHKADVLCVRASPTENVFYATGVDNLVCEYRLVTDTTSQEEDEKDSQKILGYSGLEDSSSQAKNRWIYTFSQRPHTHDIRALAISPVVTKNYRLVVTGGLDTELCVYNGLQFKQRPMKIFAYPLMCPISTSLLPPLPSLTSDSSSKPSPSSRSLYLLSCHETALELFRLNLSPSGSEFAQSLNPSPPTHLVTIQTAPTLQLKRPQPSSSSSTSLSLSPTTAPPSKKSKKNKEKDQKSSAEVELKSGGEEEADILARPQLLCSTLSPDATMVAASDTTTVKLFRIQTEPIRVTRVDISTLLLPSSALTFSVDNHLLIAASLTGLIQVLDIKQMKKIKEWPQNKKGSKLVGSISQLAVSDDGKYLATVNSNPSLPICLYNLKTLRFDSTLPLVSAPVSAVTFYPLSIGGDFSLLAVWSVPNQLHLYDLQQKCFINHPLSPSVQGTSSTPWWTSSRDRVVNLSFFAPSNDPNRLGLLVQAVGYLGVIKFQLSSSNSSSPSLKVSVTGDKKSKSKSPKKRKKPEESKAETETSAVKKDKTHSRPHTWQDHEITNQHGTAYITFIEKFRPMLFAEALTWKDKEDPSLSLSSSSSDSLDKKHVPRPLSTIASKTVSTHILVVEVPWLMLMQGLPNPLYRHRYGTGT